MNFRLVEITCNKVIAGPKEDASLESLTIGGTKVYRIEEIPVEELRLQEDEMLISCAHFHKEVFSTFGIPFLVKVKQGEPFIRVKGTCAVFNFTVILIQIILERIQKKLAVPEKEWEKFKFAIISLGRPQFITEDDFVINLSEFKPHPNNSKFFSLLLK